MPQNKTKTWSYFQGERISEKLPNKAKTNRIRYALIESFSDMRLPSKYGKVSLFKGLKSEQYSVDLKTSRNTERCLENIE